MKMKKLNVALALTAAVAIVAPLSPAHAMKKMNGNAMSMMSKQNVAEVAMSAPQFSTLVTAIKAAGLPSTLMNAKHITVFAPTNAAFAKLPAGTLEMLLKPENKATLVSILKYHVLGMKAPASKVVKLPSGTNVKTLNGETLAVRMMDGGVYLDPFAAGKAKVIKTDIMASNGVIHAIDTVLIPPTVFAAMQGN